jgi:mono/diheme cytochrome c family protein
MQGGEKMKKVVVAVCALTLLGATSAMAKSAAEIYKTVCAPCHGAKGEGKKPMGPALHGNEFVVKSPDADVIAIIKEGRAGDKKKFKEFPSPMPPQKALTGAELADLVKYLKGDLQK